MRRCKGDGGGRPLFYLRFLKKTGIMGIQGQTTVQTTEGENDMDEMNLEMEQEKTDCPCRRKHRDPQEEHDLINRLNRIEGQIRGIGAMVRDDRYCTEILTQVSAVQSALNGFAKTLLSSHIRTCVVDDIKSGNEKQAIDELCETIKRMM